MRFLPLLIASLLAWSSAGAAVSLQAPESVAAGADFQVIWSGAGDPRDFITLVPAGTEEGVYKSGYRYASASKVDMTAPDEPGDYELRFLSQTAPYETLARVAVTVTPVTATIKAAGTVDAGAPFSIEWTGPDHSKDFVTIVEAGSEERTYGHYVYTKKGNPVTLTAPDEAGAYEVRYLTGQKYYTLASAPITVRGTEASLEAPDQAQAGSVINVGWTGPDNPQDWIGIARSGATPREYSIYAYTRKGSPLSIRVPDEPGDYEIRYVTGQSDALLASRPLQVTAVEATISAPAEVRGGEPFSAEWTGPDHPRDYIGMTAAGAAEESRHTAYAYTHEGHPVKMTAPLEPGDYELRYETGQSAKILARVPIKVTPPATEPGSLRVVADEKASNPLGLSEGSAVELILDASGSMLKQQDGRRRIEIAKEVLSDLVENTIPASTPFALRVFGHKERDSCRTDLEIPLQPLDASAAASTIGAIRAMNLAKTPIARSLELVAQDLESVLGQRVVVLITDGEETCDGDLKETFRYWASLGDGSYHDATSAEDLDSSMTRALRMPFDVVNASGEIVVSGLVGDSPVVLPAGSYTVRSHADPPSEVAALVVGGEEAVVALSGD